MSTLPLEVIEPIPLEQLEADMPQPGTDNHALIAFLHDELGIPEASISMALRYCRQEQGTLPMILWRYGFVSLDQLNQIFDWLAQ